MYHPRIKECNILLLDSRNVNTIQESTNMTNVQDIYIPRFLQGIYHPRIKECNIILLDSRNFCTILESTNMTNKQEIYIPRFVQGIHHPRIKESYCSIQEMLIPSWIRPIWQIYKGFTFLDSSRAYTIQESRNVSLFSPHQCIYVPRFFQCIPSKNLGMFLNPLFIKSMEGGEICLKGRASCKLYSV